MTISTPSTVLSYAGNGSTTEFAITWPYVAKSHVVATLRAVDGSESVLVLDTGYTLTAAGATGTLTMTTAPASGETLIITSEPPNTQETDIPLGGAFPAKSVEDGLDILTQIAQKIQSLFGRSLRVPKTDTRSASQLELPNETDRASKFLAFDSNGDPVATATTTPSADVSTFMETVLDDESAVLARATLGAAGLTSKNTLTKSLVLNAADDIASATTIDLTAAVGNGGHVTGTTTITTVTLEVGKFFTVIFDGILTLTHHATNNNLNNGGSNITTAVGDRCMYWSDGTTVYGMYIRADGTALT